MTETNADAPTGKFTHISVATLDRPTAPGFTVAGRYLLREQLGAGGMGEVWAAEQREPVQRRVAVKLIKAGLDAPTLLARFEAERQALALMDHPHIAKVFDAGIDGDRPYFVMELINGLPLTQYCDTRKLGVRERLALFARVCQAVQHAHQKGIIHRDLKPSNILVSEIDGKPVPKVIDFGVAKATGLRLTDSSLYTEAGALVGTLEYMAPEQADGHNLDIDTRADVYALGVVLYELLTGAVPFTRRELQAAGFGEMLRVLKEVDPSKPSTKISSSDKLPSVAAVRGSEPRRLVGQVRGELDWIAMKCLEKDRSRRYDTANALAHDVERYLHNEPVAAGPPSASYRLTKFVQRNRGGVLAASLVVLAMLLGFAGTAAGLVTAREAAHNELQQREAAQAAEKREALQREQAERAQRHAVEALRAVTDDSVEWLIGSRPILGEQERRFLEAIRGRWESFAASQNDTLLGRELRAEGAYRVGMVWRRLGRPVEAEAAYRRTLAVQEPLAVEDHCNPARRAFLSVVNARLALLLSDTGRVAEAETVLRRSLELHEQLVAGEQVLSEYRVDLSAICNNLALLLKENPRRVAEAEQLLRRSLALREQLAAGSATLKARIDLVESCLNLGSVAGDLGQHGEAEVLNRRALSVCERLLEEVPDGFHFRHVLALICNNLGLQCKESNRWPEAEGQFRRALKLQETLVREQPQEIDTAIALASTQVNLGELLTATQPADSLSPFAESERILTGILERVPQHREASKCLGMTLCGRGIALDKLGRPTDAIANFRRAAELSTGMRRTDCLVLQCRSLARCDPQAVGKGASTLGMLDSLTVAQRYLLACAAAIAAGKLEATEREEAALFAVDQLRGAAAGGYFRDAVHRAALTSDADLSALRGRADFQTFVRELPPAKQP